MVSTAIGLVALTAALVGAPAPASSLSLTYTGAKAVKLTCDPAGGGHPQPAQACAALRRAKADPGKLKPGDSLCILLYKPVTARIAGKWRGKAVKWQHTYGNTCEMNRATGVLFDF
ncbi:SSI family serine proteinase inhibitor [Actinoplanes sp. NPDC051861]|uniref:SSI family serine proteinase inhibitor n=1 Tax=Actinoplanes sp. NPDC051861 TaxID=3155170 RepID=UPI00344829D3